MSNAYPTLTNGVNDTSALFVPDNAKFPMPGNDMTNDPIGATGTMETQVPGDQMKGRIHKCYWHGCTNFAPFVCHASVFGKSFGCG